MFLVSFGEGQDTEFMMYNSIIKILDTQLQSESELEYKG